MTNPLRRRGLLAAAALGTGLALTVPHAAHAEDTIIGFQYDAAGSTAIASTGSTIDLGPTTLDIDFNANTGDITGSMPLPGTRTEFKVAGFIPVSADVDFIEAAPITGHISLSGDGAYVESTAEYFVKLSNIKVVGFPTFAGSNCQTKDAVSIPADSSGDDSFDILNGGRLTGEYTIGDFENCGLNTWLINAIIPGSGNTVELEASNGRVTS